MTKRLALLSFLVLVPSTAIAGPFRVYVGSENPGSPYAILHAPGATADGLQVMVGSVAFAGDFGLFNAYCVDINHYLTPNRWYDANPLDSMSNWGVSDPQVRTGNSPADAGARASYLYNTFGRATDPLNRWALQVAIWNALYDSDADVTTGVFWVSAAYPQGLAAANSMLQSLALYDGPPMTAAWVRLVDAPGGGTQDFIAPIPEPASLLLLGTGLSALVAGLRRRNRKRGRTEPQTTIDPTVGN